MAILTLIVSFALIIQIQGCTDSGSVGGSLPGTGQQVAVDTLEISQFETLTLNSFSGSLNFFSAGIFQDPLFGSMEATGLLKPALPAKNENLRFRENARMQLQLSLNEDFVYGDTLASAQYNLVELSQIFRGNAFRLSDDVSASGSVIGSFTISNEDTVNVQLDDEWVQRYGYFYNSMAENRDSSYTREFFGLALIPQNSSKVIAINPGSSNFLATGLDVSEAADSTVTDSLDIPFGEWAYSLDRTNTQPSDPGSSKVINTLEQVIRFNFDFSLENLGSQNISRVELVFYRDNLMLDQSLSQAGSNMARPLGDRVFLHLVDGEELPQSIDPGSTLGPLPPRQTGFYDEADGAYHVDITNNVLGRQLEDIDPSMSFYLTVARNNGAILPNLLFNTEAAVGNTPKVIVTFIKSENN